MGEDDTANFEAIGVLIENNLMLGNGSAKIRSPLQFQGRPGCHRSCPPVCAAMQTFLKSHWRTAVFDAKTFRRVRGYPALPALIAALNKYGPLAAAAAAA